MGELSSYGKKTFLVKSCFLTSSLKEQYQTLPMKRNLKGTFYFLVWSPIFGTTRLVLTMEEFELNGRVYWYDSGPVELHE